MLYCPLLSHLHSLQWSGLLVVASLINLQSTPLTSSFIMTGLSPKYLPHYFDLVTLQLTVSQNQLGVFLFVAPPSSLTIEIEIISIPIRASHLHSSAVWSRFSHPARGTHKCPDTQGLLIIFQIALNLFTLPQPNTNLSHDSRSATTQYYPHNSDLSIPTNFLGSYRPLTNRSLQFVSSNLSVTITATLHFYKYGSKLRPAEIYCHRIRMIGKVGIYS